jgi:hypothetical protein
MSDAAFFSQGKMVNAALSIAILLCLFLVSRRHFPLLHALALLLVAGFTMILFKAAYFQCELLYYFLSFLGFLFMNRMLRRATLPCGILTGVVLGLAHLTKASVLPALLLFAFFSAGRLVHLLCLRRAQGRETKATSAPSSSFFAQALGTALVVLAFLATVYPYVRNSKRIFGRYFYNVNSTFYMWYDSWEEAKAGTRAHGDRRGWPTMPPEDIPSLSKYLREHTAEQVVGRVLSGLQYLHDDSRRSYGYYKYVLAWLAVAALVAALRFRHCPRALRTDLWSVLFSMAYIAAYLILYAWQAAIVTGDRLVLSLFLPLMFSLSIIINQKPPVDCQISLPGTTLPLVHCFNILILACVALEMPAILATRVLTMYGGGSDI